jgi:hypothetical protein
MNVCVGREVMMKLIRVIALALGVVLTGSGLTATPSWAHSEETEAQCIADARDESQLCRTVCKADLRVSKDLCQGLDPDCADACRAGEDVCRELPIADVADCMEKNCEQPLDDAKALCREQFPAATPGREDCIDAAQVAAFACRDACRDGVAEDLRQCRKAFKACVEACPPAAE